MDLDLSQIDPAILTNPTAILATNGPDGRPQQSAVWFIVEQNEIADRLGPPKYETDMRSFDGPSARRAMLSLSRPRSM